MYEISASPAVASVRSVSPSRSTWPLAPFANVVFFLLLMSTLGVRIVSVARTAFVVAVTCLGFAAGAASAGAAKAATHRAARPSDSAVLTRFPCTNSSPSRFAGRRTFILFVSYRRVSRSTQDT